MMSVLRKNPSCIPWLGEIEGRDAGVGRGSSLANKEGLETCVICCIFITVIVVGFLLLLFKLPYF